LQIKVEKLFKRSICCEVHQLKYIKLKVKNKKSLILFFLIKSLILLKILILHPIKKIRFNIKQDTLLGIVKENWHSWRKKKSYLHLFKNYFVFLPKRKRFFFIKMNY